MANATNIIRQTLTRLRRQLRIWNRPLPRAEEQPLRAELFGIAQLQAHAATLAGWHTVQPRRGRNLLLPRLAENRQVLVRTYNQISAAVQARRPITPAGEWLLDNFYLIEEQIVATQRHLPKHYSHELPRLAQGPLSGYPRIYDIAQELIAHLDGRVDAKSLGGFVQAYQQVSPLRLGELWAIPIMLRLALIENLRRVAVRISMHRADIDNASKWADRVVATMEKDAQDVVLVLADMTRLDPQMSSAFAAEFVRLLQGQGFPLSFVLAWVEQRLSGTGWSIERCMQVESQRQASDYVSVSNTIRSLRVLDGIDWHEFVETASFVEQILREDPAEAYSDMDFATRDWYRHVVEDISRRSRRTEIEVAQKAVELARGAPAGSHQRTAHVGFHLVDRGRRQLEHAVGIRPSVATLCARPSHHCALAVYLGAIAALAVAATAALCRLAHVQGNREWPWWLFGALVLMCASHAAVAVVNWLASVMVPPPQLPRLDFSSGIPPDARTLIVVPGMLTGDDAIERLVEDLEIRFLANRADGLYFGLLTDFPDAPCAHMTDDDHLATLAEQGIEALNAAYPLGDGGPFFLFHRPREWNDSEGVWMGYERKRGKLGALNALLRDGGDSRFSRIAGNRAVLPHIRYVITLDTDTQLPLDAAWKLVGTMAHPLNLPVFDGLLQRVVEGFGILQPRIAISLPDSHRSWFVRMNGGEAGIDPYTRAVSDVYQDVFGEGSFIGKGIYDVDVFEQALAGHLPGNRILSHDLLEGCFARSALVSDVVLREDSPAQYGAETRRRHRWTRGDWQIAAWVLPRVPCADGCWRRNPLSLLSQWKILDNLRRSLVPPAMAAVLMLGWTVAPPAWLWTLAILLTAAAPDVVASAWQALSVPRELPWLMHLRITGRECMRGLARALLLVACLPYEAHVRLDAVCRTLVRMLVTRRHLLEWTTASESARCTPSTLAGYYRLMWCAPALACAMASLLAWRGGAAAPVAIPILCLWCLGPAMAWWTSRLLVASTPALASADTLFLRSLALKTWRFFDTFVGPEDNWLPPDHHQEEPVVATVHRTSPTNIGLALLATLAAYDFGYIGTARLIDRTARSLETLGRLRRFRGHFHNWYDTRSLEPLAPLYVSTVDSGNLAGHLLVLRAGLRGLVDEPIAGPAVHDGLADLLREILAAAADGTTACGPLCTGPLRVRVQTMLDELANLPRSLGHVAGLLDRAHELAAAMRDAVPRQSVDLDWWIDAFSRYCEDLRREIDTMAPWIAVLRQAGDNAHASQALKQECMQIEEQLGILADMPSLRAIAAFEPQIEPPRTPEADPAGTSPRNAMPPDIASLRSSLCQHIAQARAAAAKRIAALGRLAALCEDYATLDYEFLYHPSRHLLAVGYNATEHKADNSFYDLLASESRLCSFLAIAQAKLPQDHWFSLGRLLTMSHGRSLLLSWDGSMFEYLMPLLVMPSFEGSLLDQTCKAAIERQIEYGAQRGVPWGISESSYHALNAQMDYEYRAFGVPGLGLRHGLATDVVVAPYATVMALMLAPHKAVANLRRLAAEGCFGRFGLFEAADYTPARVPPGKTHAVVASFMAHHQGMSLLALAHLLRGQPMQKRFMAEPRFKATEPLLEERVPHVMPIHLHVVKAASSRGAPVEHKSQVRIFSTAATPLPEVHILSNGRYRVMVTNAGGGYSHWNDFAVTRWREDATCDALGSFCYLRRPGTGRIWSVSHQPTLKRARSYEAMFSQGRAEFRRRDREIATHTEIAVSPEDDIELRRIHLTNNGRTPCTIELTSYAEVVLCPVAADATHPAFSKLFVHTEILRHANAILCSRRQARGERTPWMFHLMSIHGSARNPVVSVGTASFETDRGIFIGRGGSLVSPAAMKVEALSNTEGHVLDPIVAIRHRLVLLPEDTVAIDLVTGIAASRDAACTLVERYHDHHIASRVFNLAWTHGQIVLRNLNASEDDAQVYGALARAIIYPHASRRANPDIVVRNRRSQTALWPYGISGDLPIALLRVGDQGCLGLVREMAQAHAYWREKGIAVDLIIINEERAGYRHLLHDGIMGVIAAGTEAHLLDQKGGVFVRREEQFSEEDRVLLQSIARLVVADAAGSLREQLDRQARPEPLLPLLIPTEEPPSPRTPSPPPARSLVFFNGQGGFTPDGREYVVTIAPGQSTPAPWVNVLANPLFGSVVSECGSAYTWRDNAHEYRLTPWHNDPVTDIGGEAFYIRDDTTGAFWSPTPLPARGSGYYVTRHGLGYSVFEHAEDGIDTELWMYVAVDLPVKFCVLKLRNRSGRLRRLSVYGCVEWVLGEQRAASAMHVVTVPDTKSGAVLARNVYRQEFMDYVAFFNVNDPERMATGDRTEFIGRNRSLASPAALERDGLSGRIGATLDPCAALQTRFVLEDRQTREMVFVLGAGRTEAEARSLVLQSCSTDQAHAALNDVWEYWKRTLGAVNVHTPDQSVNVLANGWLLYQTIACRIMARSGYYQSGGAFGFRDQLQDVMAVVHADPGIARAHILECAGRQFFQGDVQHWWHPPSGRGVRSHCSDDYLWLPLATCRYVACTGDTGILDEHAGFLDGRPVNADEEGYYDLPILSNTHASLYDHCAKAIAHALTFGRHGLPRIGSGDWNDGMNRVGTAGEGESVWLAFFLHHVLVEFARIANMRGDQQFAAQCTAHAAALRVSIEQHAWDGHWYRRAYCDNGDPLGSSENAECTIDSLAQSWAVLSGATDPGRARSALDEAYARLVRHDAALVQLLDPPFDHGPQNPGYIKAYPPGVRENGGQYTHATVWLIMAFAAIGDDKRAWELFHLVNPIHHATTLGRMATYRVEPYVVASDVYARPPLTGRGGWTWYTGAAGWMYRLIIESLLGIHRENDILRFAPCVPRDWQGYTIHYRYHGTVYHIEVKREGEENTIRRIAVDGTIQEDKAVHLVNDGREHTVEIAMG